MSITVDINDKSGIGYLFQEWFAKWMQDKGIYFRTPQNSQEFPDFFLSENSDTEKLLEIKVFDADAGPNFDVANFEAYCRSLKTKSYRIDADYIIFSYRLVGAKFQIVDFWIKKIWDITGPSGSYGVKTQVKQGMIYNIRPIIWFTLKGKFKAFGSKDKFLQALHNTLNIYQKTSPQSANWLKEVNKNYYKASAVPKLTHKTPDKPL